MSNLTAGAGSESAAELHTTQLHELLEQLKDARIMMVDDEPVLMDILEVFLEEKGYQNCIKVEDSRQAMSIIEQEPPDILLLDLNMPHVDGFEILEAVRSNGALDRTPVIVLTSSIDAETKLKALELGATDFLAKPVDASELALRLRNTLTVKAHQDQLTYYDSLTSLPNRKLFIDRLDWSLKRAKRDNEQLAVLNLGLDRFKQINDSLGPAMGDEVLKEVSARLLACVRESDVVSRIGAKELWRQLARLGGDEFSILLPCVDPGKGAAFVASRIHRALAEKIEINGKEVYVGASIGIALYPEDGEETDLLIKNAGAATGYAKQQGNNQIQFYSKEMNARSKNRLDTEAALRRAVVNEEFVLHYQPQVDVQTGLIRSCEALIRWDSPERGLVFPDRFVPVAEDTGLILPIGDWVIQEACRQQVAWRDRGVGDLGISVNVATQQFQTGKLHGVICAALAATSMNPRRLNLEITESMLMDNTEEFIAVLHEIKDAGPSFSIDDFGTGYSSLSYLNRFPISELKIDRSFIVDTPAALKAAALVRAIIALAHSLELIVVAEGVEDGAQLEFLQSLGCDAIQGYFYSKPLPAAEFEQYVMARNRVSSRPSPLV